MYRFTLQLKPFRFSASVGIENVKPIECVKSLGKIKLFIKNVRIIPLLCARTEAPRCIVPLRIIAFYVRWIHKNHMDSLFFWVSFH